MKAGTGNFAPVWAIGLMSGTSLDGIDVAAILTDGVEVFERGAWMTVPFEEHFRAQMYDIAHGKGDMALFENAITIKHADAVRGFLKETGLPASHFSVIGFHGQTTQHRPAEGLTVQLGNGSLLAEKTGIDVVCDFRRRDVAAGGQGAPLVPIYHAALSKHLNLPVAVLNIGGIANVTWIGRSESADGDILAHDIIALDTGPGNVMLNEWALRHLGVPYDKDGELARSGTVQDSVVAHYMSDPFFAVYAPKSLDRNYFTLDAVDALSPADGAATLTEFTARSIAASETYFPVPARQWLVTGGGRHNPALMDALSKHLKGVKPVEAVGWEGDAMEAQAFAYLAVRSLRRLPLTVPTTTGVNKPVTGGGYFPA